MAPKGPIVMVCAIWPVMSGSGAKTGMGLTVQVQVQRVIQWWGLPVETIVFCAAVPGSTMPITVARRIATGTARSTAAATAGFGYVFLLGNLLV